MGIALWGLPFYYDFMVQQFGWTRAQVTSGNALSKLVIGPVFGFFAGMAGGSIRAAQAMIAGILMAGAALVGLGSVSTLGMFYFFYMLECPGIRLRGPLPIQVLLSRQFDKSRGKAMGIAYLGIGLGGAAVPWISHELVQLWGWQAALRTLGFLIVAIALPAVFLAKNTPGGKDCSPNRSESRARQTRRVARRIPTIPFFLLTLGSMFSIAAVSGTQQNLKLFLSLDLHFTQRTGHARVVAGIGVQHRWTFAYWVAGGSFAEEIRNDSDLFVGSGLDSAPTCRAFGIGRFVLVRGACSESALGGDYMIVPLMTAELFGMRFSGDCWA